MRLQQITIENFGIYEGKQTFKFPFSNKKKVSIIIGKNGAGKTTFLNAVKTCFFGSMILRNRTITKTYSDYILNKLNINALKEPMSTYSIEAFFISNIHGYDGPFSIKRSWTSDNGKMNESVIIKKNGISLNIEDKDKFFNLLYHAFPLDLFELFYLDGEKVDQLSVLNTNIIELIESSINIDLFKTLKSDLEKYSIKKIDNTELKSLEKSKENYMELIKEEKKNKKILLDKIELINADILQLATELNTFKQELNITKFNIDDGALNKIKIDINKQTTFVSEQLISFLPYIHLNDQIQEIVKQIDHENTNKQSEIIKEAMSNDLKNHLIENITLSTPKIENILNTIKDYYSNNNEYFIHNLNSENYFNLKKRIESYSENSKSKLKSNINHLKVLKIEASKLSLEEAELKAAKESNKLNTLLRLQEQLTQLKNKLEKYEEKYKECEILLLEHEECIRVIEKDIWSSLKKENATNVISQINVVINKYISQIKSDKINLIEKETKYMFDQLIRKSGFIKNFAITDQIIYLLDDKGNKLDHSHLSAGENQLFVLSLIYAIIKTSERTVPMIFDTLFGRLDKMHCNNVFEKFIGSCPDQVIILATDSEISTVDPEILKKFVNKQYIMDFSESKDQLKEIV